MKFYDHRVYLFWSSPNWWQTQYVADYDLDLLIFSTSHVMGLQPYTTLPGL